MIEGLAQDAGAQLLNYGVLGIVFVLVTTVAWWLGKELIRSHKARLEENREMVEALKASADAAARMKEALDNATRIMSDERDFKSELNRNILGLQAITVAGIQRITEKLDDVRHVAERANGGDR